VSIEREQAADHAWFLGRPGSRAKPNIGWQHPEVVLEEATKNPGFGKSHFESDGLDGFV